MDGWKKREKLLNSSVVWSTAKINAGDQFYSFAKKKFQGVWAIDQSKNRQ